MQIRHAGFEQLPYEHTVPRLKALTEQPAPQGATVTVGSEGDPELGSLPNATGGTSLRIPNMVLTLLTDAGFM